MMVIPTLREFLEAREVLFRFMNTELPYKTSVKIQRFIDNTNEIYNDYVYTMDAIRDHYSIKDTDGKVSLIPELQNEYYQGIERLMNQPLKYSFDEDNYLVDEDLEELKVSPIDINRLKWMIKDIKRGEV